MDLKAEFILQTKALNDKFQKSFNQIEEIYDTIKSVKTESKIQL